MLNIRESENVNYILQGPEQTIYISRYFIRICYRNDCKSDTIEVWTVSKCPKLYTCFKTSSITEYVIFFIIDSYLVLVPDCVKVFVYAIQLPEKIFPLVYSFLSTDKSVISNERVENPGLHEHSKYQGGYSYYNVNNYLLCNEREKNILHIWDVSNETKVGRFALQTNFLDIHSHSGNEILCSRYTTDAKDSLLFYKFDIEKWQFKNEHFEINGDFQITYFDSHVILIRFFSSFSEFFRGVSYTDFKLFDFKTSELIKQRRFNGCDRHVQFGLSFPNVIKDTFVTLCDDSFHIVNSSTLETIHELQHDNMTFITECIYVLESNFIIASQEHGKVELWDVSKGKNVLVFNDEVVYDSVVVDRQLTKLILYHLNQMIVIHFWQMRSILINMLVSVFISDKYCT